jgi:hypothetical protein
VVQGSRKKPRKGTNQLSKERLRRSLKSQSAKSARRGEIRAKRTTKQPMRPRYPFGATRWAPDAILKRLSPSWNG